MAGLAVEGLAVAGLAVVVSPSISLEALQLVPLLGQGGVQVQVAPGVGQLQGAVIQLETDTEDIRRASDQA